MNNVSLSYINETANGDSSRGEFFIHGNIDWIRAVIPVAAQFAKNQGWTMTRSVRADNSVIDDELNAILTRINNPPAPPTSNEEGETQEPETPETPTEEEDDGEEEEGEGD